MTDYVQLTDFSAKDSLVPGDPEKAILGSDVDAELLGISTAIASKADEDMQNADLATTALKGAMSADDKTKLDGIEASATADQTDDEIVAAVQSELDAKLNVAGGTMTGALTLASAPANDLEAATKAYVDTEVAAVDVGSINVAVSMVGDEIARVTDLTLTGTPSNTDPTNRYVWTLPDGSPSDITVATDFVGADSVILQETAYDAAAIGIWAMILRGGSTVLSRAFIPIGPSGVQDGSIAQGTIYGAVLNAGGSDNPNGLQLRVVYQNHSSNNEDTVSLDFQDSGGKTNAPEENSLYLYWASPVITLS